MNEDADHIFVGFQSIVRAAPHKNTGAFICNLLDRVELSEKDFMVDGHICICISRISHGISVHHERIQKAVRRFLIVGFKDLLADPALFCGAGKHLLVIQLDPEGVRHLVADLSSRASELSSDSNDRICFHDSHSPLRQINCDFA